MVASFADMTGGVNAPAQTRPKARTASASRPAAAAPQSFMDKLKASVTGTPSAAAIQAV